MDENRRILVVDDEPTIRRGYQELLAPEPPFELRSSRAGAAPAAPAAEPRFEVVEAENGARALEIFMAELAAGRRFAGAFVDVRMPGALDGLQFTQKAWELDPDFLVVLVTAYQDRSVDEVNRVFGPRFEDRWDYLTKPFSAGEIIQKARNLVSSWNRRQREKAYLARIESQQKALLAQERLAAVGKFARGIGHELGNLLQVILTKLELLPASPLVADAIEGVELGAGICKDLLTFARGEREAKPVAPVPVEQPIRRALRLLRHALDHRDAKIEVSIEPSLSLVCHETRMAQVFVNLFSNALDAIKDGGKIVVSAKQSGEQVEVKVRDNGHGISPENLRKVFEPLFTTKGDRGNGMGMVVCRTIVEDYGGRIHVESEAGRGTTVRMVFGQDIRSQTEVRSPESGEAGGESDLG